MNDELSKRQEDELSALKAIYCEDIVDCREHLQDNRWEPVKVAITVRPQDDEIHVYLDLYVDCGYGYPVAVPKEILIKNSKGLPKTVLSQLEKDLRDLAGKHAGEEVIYLLVGKVTDFLNENNKPGPKSFYDEMMSNHKLIQEKQAIEKEKLLEEERMKEELNRRLVQEEVQKKQFALRQETRLRRQSTLACETDQRSSITNHHQPLIQPPASKCSINHGTSQLKFSIQYIEEQPISIMKGKCLHHSRYNKSSDFLGLDIKTGNMYLVTEWILKWRHVDNSSDLEVKTLFKEEARKYQKSFVPIENDFKQSLLKLDHPNILSALALQYCVEVDHVSIRVLHPYVDGFRFSSLPFLMKGAAVEQLTLRSYLKQVLKGLSYIHEREVFHGDLKDSNILIDGQTGEVKIQGTLLEKKLTEFERMVRGYFPVSNSQRDLFRFGVLVLWLSSGWKYEFSHLIDSSSGHIKKLLINLNLPKELHSLIDACTSNSSMVSASELLQHDFLAFDPPEIKTPVAYVNGSDECPSGVVEMREAHTELIGRKDVSLSQPYMANLLSASSNSRLQEYEILSKLGSGGFGQVFKVKHLLDQRCYALKKIPLNPHNKLFNKKIFYEVKYLSRLNHENVVRYYGAWIETEQTDDTCSNSSSSKDNTKGTTKTKPEQMKPLFAACNKGALNEDDDSSEDEDLSEGNIFGTSFLVALKSHTKSFDDYVLFQNSNEDQDGSDEKEFSSVVKDRAHSTPTNAEHLPQKVMYIQMELCEKNTLRNAIDTGSLVSDETRRRRLFREIVEGLAHIHENEIIHRDLKPGNIFLDSRDHVKIGDFGLATSEIIIGNSMVGASGDGLPDSQNDQQFSSHTDSENKQKFTGIVGTPLYIAPELTPQNSDVTTRKIMYSQKVDMFSLGVILFEMCYPPPKTAMERNKVLKDVRGLNLPGDVKSYLNDVEVNLLLLLLHWNPLQRPSSSDLLKSDYLPPPELEEKEQQNVIRNVISNPQSKSHKFLLNTLFQRESSIVDDFVYDFNEDGVSAVSKAKLYNNSNVRRNVSQYVCSVVENVLQKYGAVRFTVPTFMPKLSSKNYNASDLFHVMDHNGTILCPPYDLRVPFARYIARNRVSSLRRYAIEKVYRERKMSYHPRELWECAFDVVTPQLSGSPSVVPDAEVISAINDIILEFPSLRNKTFTLRISHAKLLQGILLYFDIPPEKHLLVFEIIRDVLGCSKPRGATKDVDEGATTFATRRCLHSRFQQEITSETNKIQNLIHILDLEKDSLTELQNAIRSHMKKKQSAQLKAMDIIKEALSELKQIIEIASSHTSFQLKLKVSPSFVLSRSNSHLHSGVFFQIEHEVNQKRQLRVLAVGGRYDSLIEKFKFDLKQFSEVFEGKITAVGVSIEVEKVIRYVIDDNSSNASTCLNSIDVVFWLSESDVSQTILKETTSIVRSLRGIGIRAVMVTDNSFRAIDDLNRYCFENLIKFAVILKENPDSFKSILAKVISYDRERFTEKASKLASSEDVIDCLKTLVNYSKGEISGIPFSLEANNKYESSRALLSQSTAEPAFTGPISSSTNIHFLPLENNKLLYPQRKRLISQINSLLASTFNGISTLEVIALEVSFKVVKAIAGEIDFGDDDFESDSKSTYEHGVKSVCEKYQRYRSYIVDAVEKIYSIKREKKCPVITLISYIDMKFVVVS